MRHTATFAILLVLAISAGCSRPSVKADGSSTVFPVTEAVAEEFAHEHSGVRVIVGRSGTGGGFKKFSHGEIDICNASRPITEVEKQACREAGIEYIELEIAFDGLAVCVNPENDWCQCLTVDQLKAIWQPDSKVSTWRDVNPGWPDAEIELFGADTDSGTFDYFTEVIVGESGKSRSDYHQSADDNTLVMGVAGDKFGLGYFGLAYFEANKEKLKLLGIDGGDGNCVQPTAETVRENTYRPLSRPLYLYVRTSSLARSEVKSFVEFYLNEVNRVVAEAGYVPVPDEVLQKNKQILEGALGQFAIDPKALSPSQ
jgi:phosphate transport system substrate-binding protein